MRKKETGMGEGWVERRKKNIEVGGRKGCKGEEIRCGRERGKR